MCNIMLVGRDKSSGGYGVEMKLWRMRWCTSGSAAIYLLEASPCCVR